MLTCLRIRWHFMFHLVALTILREVGIEIIVLVYITIETPGRDINFGLVGVHVY